ncbi:hypothetical protein ACX2CK_05415 [Acinetobacter schindleri]
MLSKAFYSFLRFILSTHVFIFLTAAFIFINILYLWFGGWLSSINNNYEDLSFITSLLSSAATVFAAVTAAILVLNWKHQHNLTLISKLVTEIWDLHTQLTSQIYKLTYTFTVNTKEKDYNLIYAELIQLTVPLRTKSQQLQILLESRIDNDSWDDLQNYINYLEFFYPWSTIDFLEYRDNQSEFMNEFKHANASILKTCSKYISIQ